MADGNSPNRLFLKKILYRIDFQFITEKIQEEVYSFITETYGDAFIEQSQELANEIDVEIDATSLDHPRFNRKSQPIFIFRQPKTDDCDGRILKLGRTFCFLELDLRQSTMGIQYFDWIAEIINKLKTYSIFKLTRVGLRKFNNFFILDKDKDRLNDIFSIDYLSVANCAGFELDNFSHTQVYTYEDYQLRFSRNYSSGNLSNAARNIENELGHMVSFDFDLHTASDEMLIELSVDASKVLQDMNATVCNFFNSVINDNIVEKLNAGEDLSDYNVIPF